MMTSVLSDATFEQQFENQTLPPEYFNHLGHLRICWLYLSDNELETAVSRVCVGIKAYAESLGATKKFHLTITDALVRIMARRIDKLSEKSWSQFLADNTDLVEDAVSVINQYYSQAVLADEQARVCVIQPDLQAI